MTKDQLIKEVESRIKNIDDALEIWIEDDEIFWSDIPVGDNFNLEIRIDPESLELSYSFTEVVHHPDRGMNSEYEFIYYKSKKAKDVKEIEDAIKQIEKVSDAKSEASNVLSKLLEEEV